MTGRRRASAESNAALMAAELLRAGSTHLFGIMGDGNMTFMVACGQAGIDVVEVRHEAAALGMAEGYNWSSGTVGICTVTHGPGLTQLATALLVAGRNRSSVVVVTAETPPGYGGAQHFDQAAFVESCEVPYQTVGVGESIPLALRRAVAQAGAERGPVVLAVRADLFDVDGVAAPDEAAVVLPERAGPTEEENTEAARRLVALLADAQRPVIIAGRGAMSGPIADLVGRLADQVGAGLATTLPAKDLFAGHPYDLGVAGGLSSPAAFRVLQEPDLILAIGASVGRSTTQSGRLFPRARVVRLHEEAPGHPRGAERDDLFASPADAVQRALDLLAGVQPRAPWFGIVAPPAEAWQEDLRDHAPELAPGTVDPRRAVGAINPLIPDDAMVVLSNGHCSGFVGAFLSVPPAGEFFLAQGFGSIGHAFTTAVGVALGRPGRKVVVFEGDTGFMMHAQEIETAARAGADVTLFVLNDNAMGTEYQRLAEEGAEAGYAVIRSGDLAAVARALGASAWQVTGEDLDVFRAALAPGLAMVDIRTSRSVRSRHLRLPAVTGR